MSKGYKLGLGQIVDKRGRRFQVKRNQLELLNIADDLGGRKLRQDDVATDGKSGHCALENGELHPVKKKEGLENPRPNKLVDPANGSGSRVIGWSRRIVTKGKDKA